MPGSWKRAGTVAVLLAVALPGRSLRGADDLPAEPARPPAGPPPAGRPPGIDLGAHVDVNVVLPPNQWRVTGGLQNVVVAGGGRLVIDGNLTIGGEAVPEAAARIRRADEAVMVRLRQAQLAVLTKVATEPGATAARRRVLELATEADIRRLTTEVTRLRDRYASQRANLGDETWQQFQKDMQVCRRSLADPFGEDSLFAAVRAGFEPAADGP